MSEDLAPRMLLVRHGATEWSRSGRHTGRTDIPLSEEGISQAKSLRSRLAGTHFDMVLTSPLSRAVDTCRLAGFSNIEIVDDLAEWDYGLADGLTTAEIRDKTPGWTVWDGPIEGGESAVQVGERADRVIAKVAGPKNVLIFSHGHFLRVLAARWLGLEAEAGRLFALDTASISKLGYERETRVIRSWNQAASLDG